MSEYFEGTSRAENVLKTGISVVDEMMGGFLCNAVNATYGEYGSGKTTLLMQTLVNNINVEDANELFLVCDTEWGWNLERLRQIIEARKMDWLKVKDRIKLSRVSSFDSQHKLITQWWNEYLLKDGKKIPKMIIVDSFTNFYHEQLLNTDVKYLMGKCRELQGKLAVETLKLYDYATRYNACVIVVSWSTSRAGSVFDKMELEGVVEEYEKGSVVKLEELLPTDDIDMIGGARLKFLSKIILKAMRSNKVGIRYMLLRKHPYMVDNTVAIVKLSGAGMESMSNTKVYSAEEMKKTLVEIAKKKKMG